MDTHHIGKVPGAALSRVQRTCADLPQNQADSRCRPNAATLSAVHKKVQGRMAFMGRIATLNTIGDAGRASHSAAVHATLA